MENKSAYLDVVKELRDLYMYLLDNFIHDPSMQNYTNDLIPKILILLYL